MDHNPPPITTLFDAVEEVYNYVNQDHRNVAAVHCKAGKGRTGVVICCFLLRCGEHISAEDALRYYGVVRTSNGKGVTIASQQRYIGYYSAIVEYGVPRAVLANPVTRTLVGFRVRGTPKGGCNGMFFKVMQDVTFVDGNVASNKWKSTAHQGNSLRAEKENPGFVLDVRADLAVRGDVLVQCVDKVSLLSGGGSKKLFHFWFNTFFVRDNYLCLTKFEIDGPHKDKKETKWFDDFQVELFFAEDNERHDWRTSVAGWEVAAARAARFRARSRASAASARWDCCREAPPRRQPSPPPPQQPPPSPPLPADEDEDPIPAHLSDWHGPEGADAQANGGADDESCDSENGMCLERSSAPGKDASEDSGRIEPTATKEARRASYGKSPQANAYSSGARDYTSKQGQRPNTLKQEL